MNFTDPLPDHAAQPIDAAQALVRTEETLKLLSMSWYQLAADAAPTVDGLSHEEKVRRIAALQDVAAAFARCARACREARSEVARPVGIA